MTANPGNLVTVGSIQGDQMHINQIELILLLDRGSEATLHGLSMRVEGEPNSFAVSSGQNCLLIGAISLLSQSKSDEFGGHNLTIQRGVHSAPCSFMDVIEVFDSDISKMRIVDVNVADFKGKNTFFIPRFGGCGFTVEAKVNGLDVSAVRLEITTKTCRTLSRSKRRSVLASGMLGWGHRKSEDNSMHQDVETRLRNLRSAPRCGAKTRAGTPCQRPTLRGRSRCRLHGGLSPGAPRGPKNGNFKTGDWTADAVAERKWLRSLVRAFAGTGKVNDE
jgi:hypothetical protein